MSKCPFLIELSPALILLEYLDVYYSYLFYVNDVIGNVDEAFFILTLIIDIVTFLTGFLVSKQEFSLD